MNYLANEFDVERKEEIKILVHKLCLKSRQKRVLGNKIEFQYMVLDLYVSVLVV